MPENPAGPADIPTLQSNITDEIFRALGLPASGWLRRLLGPIFGAPTRRFAALAAWVDQHINEVGFSQAARDLLPHFARRIRVRGAESLPREGPLVVATNHPGVFDSVALSAAIHRDDLKIIASGVPFLRHLPTAAWHLIYTTSDAHERMAVLRSAIRHVRQGGALLLFASGGIDPDPAVLPGARQALARWTSSLEIIARAVPEVQVALTIVSGVLSPAWAHSPLIGLRQGMDGLRIVEFFQTMHQMLFPGSLALEPHITFLPPFTPAQVQAEDRRGWMQAIEERAGALLDEHTAALLPQTT